MLITSREFTIECQGVGVLPPLSLSSTVIHLPATPINDQSIAVFYIENRHLDKNHFKHPVPRIGNGEFAPVGPTSFQFDVPSNAPITLSPLVGTVQPGTVHIHHIINNNQTFLFLCMFRDKR